MRIWRSSLPVVIVLASLTAFCAAGHFAAKALIDAQQLRQLDELADVVLRRSEVVVDFGSASIDEIARSGRVGCEPSSLQIFRLHVYQRSAIKDIRLVNADGSVICSAYSETLEFDKDWVSRPNMLASRDKSLLLFRVEQFGGDALGVMRDLDDKRAMVAILGINSSLFDIMPAELRPRSQVLVELSNGQQLGHFSLEDHEFANGIDFVRRSARYPLQATIRVDSAALAKWNRQGTQDGSTAAIVEMLVRLARDLHMNVIAEGIETEDQVSALTHCGVEEGQGYLVSPPVPPAKFIELFEIRQARADIMAVLQAPLVA
jgi:c-di-GMP phosphodiesterase